MDLSQISRNYTLNLIFLVSHCFSIVFETFSYDDSGLDKGKSPLKSMKNIVNRRFEMKFISMIGKTVRDNTSGHLWTYLGSYYALLDGLTYHKQLFFSRPLHFSYKLSCLEPLL